MILHLIDFHGSDDPVYNIGSFIYVIVFTLFGLDICNSWTGLYDSLPFITHKNFFIRSLFKILYMAAAAGIMIVLFALIIVIGENLYEIYGPLF
jgi:hypothetical protein